MLTTGSSSPLISTLVDFSHPCEMVHNGQRPARSLSPRSIAAKRAVAAKCGGQYASNFSSRIDRPVCHCAGVTFSVLGKAGIAG